MRRHTSQYDECVKCGCAITGTTRFVISDEIHCEECAFKRIGNRRFITTPDPHDATIATLQATIDAQAQEIAGLRGALRDVDYIIHNGYRDNTILMKPAMYDLISKAFAILNKEGLNK